MKFTTRIAFVLVASLGSLAMATPSLYVTAYMGQSSSDVPVPKEYLANIKELSSSTNYLSYGLGMRLSDSLAVEATYFKIAGSEIGGTFNSGTDFPYAAHFGSNVQGLQCVAKPGFTAFDRLGIFAILGVSYEIQEVGMVQRQLERLGASDRKGLKALAGFGLDVRVWEQLRVGLEYRYLPLKIGNANIVSASASWQF